METDTMANVDLGDDINHAGMGDTMDDLFGDAADGLDLGDVNVSLPTVSFPPPPALLLRLADMQSSGCCTKLAWSNTGSIAQITEDGLNITFRVFLRNLKTKLWYLSDESTHKINAPDGCHFTHIQFNNIGQDLAIADSIGRVHLYAMSGGNAKMQLASPETQTEKSSELDAIVGLHWLPQYPLDCRSVYIGPVSRSVTGWTSQARPREINAVKVHHPSENSRALLYVSRNGKLIVRYQHDGWKSAVSSLETFTSSDTLLTHADLCEHNGGLLLVVFDAARKLRLFSLGLVWNATIVPGPVGTQQVTATAMAPELHVTPLLSLQDPLPQHMDHAKLVQLKLVPTTAEVADQSMSTSTTVLATFIRAVTPGHTVSEYQDSSTILVRWQVESETPTLHNGFRQLKPSAQVSSTTGTKTLLQRQPDLVSSKIILSVQSKCFDTILACVASDGTVEFRDRATFELLESYMDTDHVYSLPQSGFSYLSGEHNVHAAISYDGSAMAVMRPDGKLKTFSMAFQYGWPRPDDNTDSSQLAEAAVVCLARQYMIMVYGNISPDEVLSLLPPSLPDDLKLLITREAFRLARNTLDITAYDEKTRSKIIFSDTLLPRAFSLQLYLGLDPVTKGRSFTSQYAWAVLNLRHIGMATALMRFDPNQGSSIDVVISLSGQIKWAMDLMTYILNALLSVKDIAVRDLSKPARGVFENYMHETNNPAFLLVLCSWPRTLLRLITQVLPRLIKFAQAARSRARSVQDWHQLSALGRLEATLPFSFEAFKTFLDHTESAMNAGQPAMGLQPKTTPSPDIIMTITGKLPEELEQPLRALLISAIPTLLQDANWSNIYFADCTWLGFGGPKSMQEALKFDVVRKIPLPPNVSLRKCRRCGSAMEDINIDRPKTYPHWVILLQRYCICMCTWYVE